MHLSRSIAAKLAAGLMAVTVLVTPSLALSGTVIADGGLRMRTEASSEASILDTLPKGTKVEVLQSEKDGWYQVSYQDTKGYVSADYLTVEKETVYGKVTEGPLNVRSGPSTGDDKVGKLTTGQIVEIDETLDGWYKVDSGYVSAEFITIVDASEAAAAASASSKGEEISRYAQTLVGSRYVYGGSSPSGFDCSGFTKYVYGQFGYTLNRTASAQLDNGTAVSMSELQPGDLVFFKKSGTGSKRASHVGIYIGGGQFVHASTSRVGVIISDMDSAYYTSGFVGGRRLA